jgi:hypothetical protein
VKSFPTISRIKAALGEGPGAEALDRFRCGIPL